MNPEDVLSEIQRSGGTVLEARRRVTLRDLKEKAKAVKSKDVRVVLMGLIDVVEGL